MGVRRTGARARSPDIGLEKPGKAQHTPPAVTATAFYYQDVRLLSRIAELLGHTDTARDFAAHAERIRASYNRRFFDRAIGVYATGSQRANAIPLVMGIVEPDDRARVLDALVRDVEARGYAVTAGDIGFRYLLQALAQGGRSDVIFRIISQDEKPGYGHQLKKGATSLTESWDANRESSHNHFMLGHITEWFYQDLAGIAVDRAGPGFKKILIRPQTVGDLTWVEASHEALSGKITVRWEREPDYFKLHVAIPANTTATVFVPARHDAVVRESGAAAKASPGITFLRREGDRMVYSIESGDYLFESSY